MRGAAHKDSFARSPAISGRWQPIALLTILALFLAPGVDAVGAFNPPPVARDQTTWAAEQTGSEAPFRDGVVLAGFHPGTGKSERDRAFNSAGARETEVVGGDTHVLEVEKGRVHEAIHALRSHSHVRYAEPDYLLFPTEVRPDDVLFDQLWGLVNTGQAVLGTQGTVDADVDAELAWDLTRGPAAGTDPVVVGVIDTGVDYLHADLISNMWTNPGTVNSCPAGTHGYDALANECDPMDEDGHGTHVSGTIGASGNNSIGVTGVNWITSMMAIRFLGPFGGSTADAIESVDWAIRAKKAGINLRVLNNSWGGGGFSTPLLDKIKEAGANDILFVAAAGNAGRNVDFSPFYPCSYSASNIVCVAATDQNDARANFSNYGKNTVHLGAPGANILSTHVGNTYVYLDGTSMATPHVSGAAALALSTCSLSTANLKSLILSTVDTRASLTDVVATGGRLNVDRAVRGCSGAPLPDFALTASPSTVRVKAPGAAEYTITITPSGGSSGQVTLAVSGLPSDATGAFVPNPVDTSSSTISTLTVTTKSTTPLGRYTLTITGTSGSITRSTTAVLQVRKK